jgi:DNA replicative helicase MCM subunit Mcm2 (Cdc46/Mcm family)
MNQQSMDSEASYNSEASYICDSCGEEIVVPIDFSQGHHQQYVEDCPVCCSPNVISVWIDDDGQVTIHAQAE